jgi:hypothetical protein
MQRRLAYSALAVLVLALLAGVYLVGRATSTPNASAATTSTSTTLNTTAPVTGFYLDIGGSASLGFQPDGVLHHNGKRTDEGYANDVIALEAKNIAFSLRQVGCPGETVQSMLGLFANHCYHLPTTQLEKSVDALIADGDEEGLVTIDLGFNNIRPCMLAKGVSQFCVNQGVNYVKQDMPKILKILQGAAGPNVHFVGIEYADPFLGYYLNANGGPAVATETLNAMTLMNNTLAAAYEAANIPVANVAGAYQSDNNSPYTLANVGTIPHNVAIACQWTWMCTPPPFGPDDHPNNAGYMIIAKSVVATLPTNW